MLFAAHAGRRRRRREHHAAAAAAAHQPHPNTQSKQNQGYGSLAHTPGFRYRRRIPGFVRGHRRVWWQGSTDHRGTPAAPGRTVTLVPDAAATAWGAAYELDGDDDEVDRAIVYLEWREKQYDVRCSVDVLGANGEVLVAGARCYVASDSVANVNWLGPAPVEAIAAQVRVWVLCGCCCVCCVLLCLCMLCGVCVHVVQ